MLWEILYCLFWALVVAQSATLDTTMYLHRGSTHKAVEYHPAVEFLFQLKLWLTTGIKRLQWVAVHLYHHVHTDEDGDPHSPVLLGFWRVQLLNVKLYRDAAKKPEVMWCSRNIKLSWAEKNLFCSPLLGLSVGITLACLIFGLWQGLVISLFHTLFYLQLNSLVNAYCHVRGYKNFPGAQAFNSHWVAWITCGEGFHNDHHHRPGNPKLSERRSEFDIGWGCIKILTWLHLAHVNK